MVKNKIFLFVLENYLPHIGGLETIFQNLMEGLVKQGNEVNLVTHRISGTSKYEEIGGVKIYRVSCFWNRYLFTFTAIWKTFKLAKNVDVIHTTTYTAAFPARVAALLRSKPVIITVHEVLGKNWNLLTGMSLLKGKIHQLLEKIILSLNFNKFVCVSNSTMKDLESLGLKKEKVSVVYNGMDYDFWNPNKYNDEKFNVRKNLNLENKFIYLFYGRPGISKGLEYLLRAVPIISRKIPNSKLLAIVSKDKTYDKQYSKVMELIEELNIKDNIVLQDPVMREFLPYFLKSANCIVIPSLTEGFGFNVTESCAMRIPVVASNTHSIPEVISGKYIFAIPRSSESIAAGVINSFEKKYNISSIKRFTTEKMLEGYLEVYSSL